MRRFSIPAGLAVLIVVGLGACSVRSAHLPIPASHPPSLSKEQRILHVLNRLGFGPRPGDLERVKAMGLETYIQQQLFPERIPDPGVERELPVFPTLAMTTAELLKAYPQPDPAMLEKLASGEMSRMETMGLYPLEKRPVRITLELQSARLLRAILSERQLQEVMVDFWFNHFNVFAGKGAVRWMLTSYERDAIRPHALGKFQDLLLAVARHPAMLFYLDNWLSVRGDSGPGPRGGVRPTGLNENYARELLELHTLGVDGGYTQRDIVEVARCFTGWSIDRPRIAGTFVFRRAAHDAGEKLVLGQRIPAGGGERDGERLRSPAGPPRRGTVHCPQQHRGF